MGNRVNITPASGIRTINGVGSPQANVDLISSDASISITPNTLTKQIDLTASSSDVSGTIITNVPCAIDTYVNAAVRMSSGIAINALADSLANSNVIGIVESKQSSTLCTVRVVGVSGMIFSGLDEAQEYYLSDSIPGGITTTVPTISGHVLIKLGQPYTSDRLLVMKGIRVVRG